MLCRVHLITYEHLNRVYIYIYNHVKPSVEVGIHLAGSKAQPEFMRISMIRKELLGDSGRTPHNMRFNGLT